MHSEGGFFNATLSFPQDYPQSPPTCRFTSEMWHPNGEAPQLTCTRCSSVCRNSVMMILLLHHHESGPSLMGLWGTVYPDGRVCISILHNPGDDPHGYERASERWSPVHTVRPCSPVHIAGSIYVLFLANNEARQKWANALGSLLTCCSAGLADQLS